MAPDYLKTKPMIYF